MNSAFIERLSDLELLSQNHQTSEIFEQEYMNLLHEVQDEMRAMKALALIQAAWLKTEGDLARKDEGIEQ